MLVKVNAINEVEHKIKVTILDIDDYGSVIPLIDVELNLPLDDDSVIKILKNSSHAAVFTEGNSVNNNATIILANGITDDELNEEKRNTIYIVMSKKGNS